MPDTNYQVAPWICFEEVLRGMLGLKLYPEVQKHHRIKKENEALCSFECAQFFFMWKDWNPWSHYTKIENKLREAHKDILSLEHIEVFFSFFFYYFF
jgi:hypothetical protein